VKTFDLSPPKSAHNLACDEHLLDEVIEGRRGRCLQTAWHPNPSANQWGSRRPAWVRPVIAWL